MEPTPRVLLEPDGRILVRAPAPARERWSWALYDFANTIFSMNVVTLYFAVWIVTERGASNTAYSLATSISSAAVLVLAPWIGAVSDASRRRKPWVVGLTLLCVAATLALSPLSRGGMPSRAGLVTLLAVFAVANTAYQLALPPYNAMLPELVPPSDRGKLSGLGTAVGYLGSIAGVLLVAPAVTGGLGFPAGGRAASFAPTALLFLLFSLPLFFFCHDHLARPRAETPPARPLAVARELSATFRDARRHPGLLRFVVSSYFYQDALGTAISFMALYAVAVLGLPVGGEIRLFVTLTIPAIVGAFLAGRACDRWGPRRTLRLVLVGWIVGLLVIALAPSLSGFWIGGFLVGLFFGGIWSAERPLLLTLVPAAESGRFFGLLALSARAAAIVGPLLWAAIVDGLSERIGPHAAYRIAVGSLTLMMLVALWLLGGVPDRVAEEPLPSHRMPA
ncbi:MAG: MFS transporter [Thermoanaerobaculia bacterium]